MKIFNSIIMVTVFMFMVCGNALAANSQSTTDFHVFATVDTAPGASGYFTDQVNIRGVSDRNDRKAWFSIRGTGTMTVTLQFKADGDADWTDYDDYTENERKVIEGGAKGEVWRAIVKNGNYSSGSKTFGLDW